MLLFQFSCYFILVSIRARCRIKLSLITSSDVIKARNKYTVIKYESVKRLKTKKIEKKSADRLC